MSDKVQPSLQAISDRANHLHTDLMGWQKLGGAATIDQLIDVLEVVGSLAHALANQNPISPPANNRPPFETFKRAICKGSYVLGSACGQCERCEWERGKMNL